MTALGVGLIGCGSISATYLKNAPLFRDFRVIGIADLDPSAATRRAAEYAVRVMDIDTLLSNPDIAIVLNLTVPAAHAAVSQASLNAGKHVYSEKPLAMSVEDGIALQASARQTGLRLGAAPDTFLGGAAYAARTLIDTGAIGPVHSASLNILSPGMEHWHPNPDFFYREGGGPVFDMGPYYLALMVHLLGPIRRVAALSTMPMPTRTITSQPRYGDVIPVETPTTVQALIDFHSGATAVFSASWDVQAHRQPLCAVFGTKGSLYLPDPNHFGGPVNIAVANGKTHRAPVDHPFSVANQEGASGAVANYRGAGLADMARSIRDGRPHRCSLELALHIVDAITAILRSGDTGTFVDLTTSCARPVPLGPDDAHDLLSTD